MNADTKEEFKKLILQTIDEKSETDLPRDRNPHHLPVLRKNYSLKREEIPEKLETFMEGLHEFFRSGAHMIEQTILKELHLNLGLNYKSREGYRFVDYIDDLKNVYQAIRKPPKSKWLQRVLPKT